jgi:MFS transporter, DHA2 family, multidrug resistance protein
LIVWCSLAAVAGIMTMLAGQFVTKAPILRLKLLANKSYASVIVIVFIVGAGLYSVSYMVPQFLNGIAGYNSQQSGIIMLISGIPAFLMVPVLPRLLSRVDARYLVIAGLICFAASCALDVSLTSQSVGHDFIASQLLRGFGQMLAMMPLNRVSLAAVPIKETADAAGLYNMARNLGGSVGLAMLGTFIDRRNAFHDAIIRDSVSANSSTAHDTLASTAGGFLARHGDAAYAQLQALGRLAAQIQQQAATITYSETFFVLAAALLLCIPLATLLGQPRSFSGPLMDH